MKVLPTVKAKPQKRKHLQLSPETLNECMARLSNGGWVIKTRSWGNAWECTIEFAHNPSRMLPDHMQLFGRGKGTDLHEAFREAFLSWREKIAWWTKQHGPIPNVWAEAPKPLEIVKDKPKRTRRKKAAST